jgi:hypothetical protein
MYRSLKTISMIAITITTMGVMPSYGLQLGMSSNAAISSLPEASVSQITASYSKNSKIPYTLLVSDNSSCGRTVSERADQIAYPGIASFYATISLSGWKNASYAERCDIARTICSRYDGSRDFLPRVVLALGGRASILAKDSEEGTAIILASIQTVCPARYPQVLRDIQNNLSQ